MGFRAMRKMKIGYWSLSPTLKSAGDRRRLIFWAKARGHDIVIDRTQKVDVIVASENSDFNSKYFAISYMNINLYYVNSFSLKLV